MKKEIRKEIAGATQEALNAMLGREREKARVFRFRVAQGKVKNVKEGREARKAIARILTRVRELRQSMI